MNITMWILKGSFIVDLSAGESPFIPSFQGRSELTLRSSSRRGIGSRRCRGDFEDYPTPNSFFTRELKDGVRHFMSDPNSVFSPVDGTISIMDEVSVRSDLDSSMFPLPATSRSTK